MNDPSGSPLSFECPHCGKRLRVAASYAGKRSRCPGCGEKIVVPEPPKVEEDADSWLQLDGPRLDGPRTEPRPATKPGEGLQPVDEPKPGAPKLGASTFDDDLPELKPLDPELATPLTNLLSDFSLQFDEEHPAPTAPSTSAAPSTVDEEFSFSCKVCGTLLYSPESQVGTKTQCPDCHSKIQVPKPTAKKQKAETKIDHEVANVRLAPIEGANRQIHTSESVKTKEILERAEKEAAMERQELDGVAAPFDSQRWLSLIFGFFRDPGVIFLAAILGVCAAVCFFALHAIGSLDRPEIQKAIIRLVVFLCFALPLLAGILMCCMVILPMAANRRTRVDDWPFGRFGDAFGELIMLTVALIIAAIPGGFLASVMSLTILPSIFREVIVLLSIWAFTPLILLSMIENNAIAQPFSSAIFKSFSDRSDAWGAMYMQSGMAITGLFVVYAIGYVTGPLVTALLGLMFPVGLFFIANQYGILAGRISDITNLGFEGDFSEDLVD